MTRVALVGVGAMGRHHLEACRLTPGAELVAVCDLNRDAAHQLAPGVAYFPTFEALLESRSCDMVIINTPHHLHDSMAIAAMEAGLHVLVEKPMATTLAGCDALIAAMERTGVHLGVGHIQHHLPDKVAAKQFLGSGQLGDLVAILDSRTARYGDSSRPEWFNHVSTAGGGVMFNLGAHCVDRALWFTGARVESVTAWVTHRFGLGVETDGSLTMQLSDGTPATVTITSNAPDHVDQLVLIGTEGTVVCDPLRGVTVRTQEGSRVLQGPMEDPMTAACHSQLRDFLTEIDRESRSSNAFHARHVVEVLEGAYLAASTGGSVKIPSSRTSVTATTVLEGIGEHMKTL